MPDTIKDNFAKILATVGPASRDRSVLRLLVEAGADAFRVNFSHGEHAGHAEVIRNIRAVGEELGRHIAVVADMQGPKIRVGELGDGLELRWGQEVVLRLGAEAAAGEIPVPHAEIFQVSEPGNRLKFDDGKLQVTVREVGADSLTAVVDVPGRLSSRKGLNVVDAVLPLSAMTPKDEADMRFALGEGVDYVALSFVQTADDVREARAIVGDQAGLIVKLEKPAALHNLDAILADADAAMVARGDLGVELPLEDVPIAQRRIIRECRRLGKPVIVATHMLESMIDAPTPTRAEASDVASAIYQGADVVMLSAETAVGRHPATAVAVMDRIIGAVEADPTYWDVLSAERRTGGWAGGSASVSDAISRAAGASVRALGSRAVFGYTSSGSTVRRIARERPPCPVIGLTPSVATARRLALVWGVRCVLADTPDGFDDISDNVEAIARRLGLVSGDSFVITLGVPFGVSGSTNTLRVGVVG